MAEVHQSTLDATLQKEVQELKEKIGEFCQSVSFRRIYFNCFWQVIERIGYSIIICRVAKKNDINFTKIWNSKRMMTSSRL